VQAGNVLRELFLAYEFAIGLGRFDASFANSALLAKSSLRQTRIKLTNNRGTRVLSEAVLKKFLQWLPGSAFSQQSKTCFVLPCGQVAVPERSVTWRGRMLIWRRGRYT